MNYADAYDAGFIARTRGEPRTACHYRRKLWRDAWLGGWTVADNRDREDHARMARAHEQIGRDLVTECHTEGGKNG